MVSISSTNINGEATITMSSSEADITSIHYTTDGTVPTLASPLYEGPFSVGWDATIRAAGFDRFATRTPLNEKSIHIGTAAPAIAGVEKGKLTLSCATEGASILYTTDGSDPRLNGQPYSGAFAPGDITKAVAIVRGRARSDVVTIAKLSDGSLFRDVDPKGWYFDALNDVVERGLMGSVGDYRFDPASPLTRAALVSILYRMEGSPAVKPSGVFADVPADTWYTSAVNWAASKGIITGKSETIFDPNASLTRQQAAAIVKRYADYDGRRSQNAANLDDYADGWSVGRYAREAVAWCAGNGLLSAGVPEGQLLPEAPMTRAQCAVAISLLREIR